MNYPIWEGFRHPLYALFAERERGSESSMELTPRAAARQRSLDKTQEWNQLIPSNQRRGCWLLPLLDRDGEGSSRAELTDDGDGMGTGRISIAVGRGPAPMATRIDTLLFTLRLQGRRI